MIADPDIGIQRTFEALSCFVVYVWEELERVVKLLTVKIQSRVFCFAHSSSRCCQKQRHVLFSAPLPVHDRLSCLRRCVAVSCRAVLRAGGIEKGSKMFYCFRSRLFSAH